MALRAIEFPVDTMTATVAAVSAIALVFAAAGPEIRKYQLVQKDWRDAKTSLVHAQQKLQAVAEAMNRAKTQIETLDQVNIDTAVVTFTSFRTNMTDFVDSLQLCIKAIEHCRSRMLALRKHFSILRKTAPGIEKAIDEFDELTADLSPLRTTLDVVENDRILEQLDDMLEQAVESGASIAVLRAKELAKASSERDAARAMQRLLDLHDQANARGVKVGE